MMARLHADPAFRAEMEAAKAEVATVRAKGLKPTRDCQAEADSLAHHPKSLDGETEILQSWTGDFPVAQLQLLPEKQRQRALLRRNPPRRGDVVSGLSVPSFT